MNLTVLALMFGIAVGFVGLLTYAVTFGHTWLLAGLVIFAVAAFTPWHRLG